jgi:hypothetical protein
MLAKIEDSEKSLVISEELGRNLSLVKQSVNFSSKKRIKGRNYTEIENNFEKFNQTLSLGFIMQTIKSN